MCDIIWCKKEKDGKVCNTVNYLDPYCFWNWEGKTACAECGTVYYIHMIQGHMYAGPDEKPGHKPDMRPSTPTSPWTATVTISPALKAGPGPTTACPVISTWARPTW